MVTDVETPFSYIFKTCFSRENLGTLSRDTMAFSTQGLNLTLTDPFTAGEHEFNSLLSYLFFLVKTVCLLCCFARAPKSGKPGRAGARLGEN